MLALWFSLSFFSLTMTSVDTRTPNFCGWLDHQSLVISELRAGQVKREYLGKGECNGQHASIRFENVSLANAEPCSFVYPCANPNSQILFSFRGSKHTPVNVEWDGGSVFLTKSTDPMYRIRKTESHCPFSDTKLLNFPLRTPPVSFSSLEIPSKGKFAASRGRRYHTGLDVPSIPAEVVLAPADGEIVLMSQVKTQAAFFLKHRNAKGKVFYTSLAHLKDLKAEVGQCVATGTPLGRTLNEDEFAHSKHRYIHVHLELRKSVDDFGGASVNTRTRNGLKRIFENPLPYLLGEKFW